ncbi:YchJ family metal-binding protein [Iodobacter sp. CM08]|uniref:YchJ family protein n=1 Tax=Iodobacter sp. CM08 TaxID=3085902 RepID=UPI0029810753|nr:YchJ family metal-binding protein [Iodobacter sp. CM08]MDW5417642.1 YchJ family metal-binding protein [Iodobacter sp. CM08]
MLKENGCPCESGRVYADCCAPWHQGTAATTPEQLMRSRYSAFVLGLHDYLLATWHATTRPETLVDEEPVRWLGLKIKQAHVNGVNGEVEFIARYKIAGKAWKLHERSRFVYEEGRWYYLDGEMLNT